MTNYTGQNYMMGQRDLPNSTAILILGIASIVTCICYGFIGVILGTIALVLAAKDKERYLLDPDLFTHSSYKNLNAGRITAIVGLSLSVLYIIILILIVVFSIMGEEGPFSNF